MSVTITIANNELYCRANGLVEADFDDCCFTCNPWGDGVPFPGCHTCNGTGCAPMLYYPFATNLSNDNFSMLWNALALPFDWCGSIDGRLVLDAVRCFDSSLLLRETQTSKKKGRIRCINMGVHEEQAERYLDSLRKIAEEATRREEKIGWY